MNGRPTFTLIQCTCHGYTKLHLYTRIGTPYLNALLERIPYNVPSRYFRGIPNLEMKIQRMPESNFPCALLASTNRAGIAEEYMKMLQAIGCDTTSSLLNSSSISRNKRQRYRRAIYRSSKFYSEYATITVAGISPVTCRRRKHIVVTPVVRCSRQPGHCRQADVDSLPQ